MPGLPARPRPWPAPTSAALDSPVRPPAGTPHESLKRSRTKRSSDGHPLPLGHGRVHDAHPAPPVDLGRHAEEGDHGRLDHPGVDGGHHQLTRVLSHHLPHGARGPRHELGPALAARRDGHGGVVVPVGYPEGLDHLAPLHAVGLARGATRRGHSVPAPGRGPSGPARPRAAAAPPSRSPGAAPRSTAPSPGAARRSRRGGRPAPPPDGGPGRSAPCSPWPADDAVQVALRLAVAHQHDPGGALLGREDPQHARLGAFVAPGSALGLAAVLAHARLPTKCSSWRSVRHSTTSSQWAAYSPTMESPEPQ